MKPLRLTKISTTTEVLSLVKAFDFSTLQSDVQDLQTLSLKQEEKSAVWTKHDTSEIKSMITEIYQAFKGQPSSAPLSSVTLTLALTHIPANVEGENATHTATEEPPSHTEGETEDPNIANLISSIQPTKLVDDPSKNLVHASTIVRPDPDKPIRIEFMINGKIVYLTKQEIQEYWDKEEKIKKAEEQARLLAISKPEVIKVVREEAKKLGIDPKEAITTEAGEVFKKARDVEHQVLKRQHTEKVKKSLELRKHNYDIYKGTDGRNFDVHNPFLFGKFGISELDELWEIIPKKKNAVVKDLMNSPSRRYERLRKIPKELRIQSALPAPAPEQASSQTSGRKRKHIELEPKVKVSGLECNRSLSKVGVDALVSYLVMASTVKTEENARFSLKLRKLIAGHPDQEKLKSKKVKLEELGYYMD
ncbi:hypothetical protein Tco_0361258 [Tanacetum coccineum]